jgi:hypothetical protein
MRYMLLHVLYQVEREIATRLIEIAALKKETDALSKARLQKLEEEVRISVNEEPFVHVVVYTRATTMYLCIYRSWCVYSRAHCGYCNVPL